MWWNSLGRFPIGDFEPFKLVKPIKPVSKIEIEFKTDGRYFAYGVEFSANGIKEEWLYEINARSDKKIFTRKTDSMATSLNLETYMVIILSDSL